MNDSENIHNIPDWFWDTIEQAQGEDDMMRTLLERMSEERLSQFAYWYQEAVWELCTEPYLTQVATYESV